MKKYTKIIWALGFGMVVAVFLGSLFRPDAASARMITVQEALAAWQVVPNVFPRAAERAPERALRVFATAYSSDPFQTDDTPCIPAMGSFDLCENFELYGQADTIAANFLPLGTRVRFPDMYGKKIFTVRDRMNSRYSFRNIGYYRIDFYTAVRGSDGSMDAVASRDAARAFGARQDILMEVF